MEKLYKVFFTCHVVSDSVQPHGLQHTSRPCPSLSHGVCSNSCSLSWWCHPNTSSSVVPFSSCPQPIPTSGSFPISRFSTSGVPKYWSFIFSISPPNEYLISLPSKGFSRVFSSTTIRKDKFFSAQPSLWSSCHTRTWLLEKP